MDVAKSITFFTEDERWLEKLGIGVGVMIISAILSPILIGVVGFFIVVGYCIRLLQNVRDGVTNPLPDWDRWGDDLMLGFKLMVVIFIWSLPTILFVVPLTVGSVLAGNSDTGAIIGIPLIICGSCLMILYALFVVVAQPAITVAFAREGTIRSGLQLNAIWLWTSRNIGPVLITTIVVLAAGFVLGLLGMILGVLLCFVGFVVSAPLATLLTWLIQYHLYGQLAHDYPWDDATQLVTTSTPEPIIDTPAAPLL